MVYRLIRSNNNIKRHGIRVGIQNEVCDDTIGRDRPKQTNVQPRWTVTERNPGMMYGERRKRHIRNYSSFSCRRVVSAHTLYLRTDSVTTILVVTYYSLSLGTDLRKEEHVVHLIRLYVKSLQESSRVS